jgi:hypothetical protein
VENPAFSGQGVMKKIFFENACFFENSVVGL